MSIPGPERPVVLALGGVSKAFGAVQALRDVSFDCRAGEVHALVGENGSGKSTLLGIASGFLAPDAGTVEIGGRRRRCGSPAGARRFGLGMGYPTCSHLPHRRPEGLGIAGRVTVLRDGVSQGTFDAAGMSEESLVALMIGRPLQHAFPDRNGAGRSQDVLLAVSGLRGDRFGPIDLEVRKGEILGLAGAEGNGQVQFLRALAGVERPAGTASCNGQRLDTKSPLSALRAGIVLLSGDRVGESLFPVLSVRANTTVQVLRRLGRWGFLRRRRERDTVDELVRRLRIRMASVEQPVQSLSGGNQQKVSLTRPFLRGDVKIILAEEPTQGVDVGARLDIYEALRGKADEGVAIIVKSSDPLELAGLCDRVIVMSRGKIVDEIQGADLGERRIVEAIVGARVVQETT